MILLPRLLSGVRFRAKDKNNIKKCLPHGKRKFVSIVKSIIGSERNAEAIWEYISNDDFESLQKLKGGILRGIIRKNLEKNLFATVIRFLKFSWTEFKFRIKPNGLFLVLIGPDGAGKSTVSEKLMDTLSKILINRENKIFHWKPGVLPFAGGLKRLFVKLFIPQLLKKNKKDFDLVSKNKTIKRRKSTNAFMLFLKTYLRLSILTLDYLIGYILRVWPVLYRDGLVIFDRYLYDFIVAHPERSKMYVSDFVKKILVKIVPRPDLVIFLKGDPVILFQRKREFSIEDLAWQINQYEKFLGYSGLDYIKLDSVKNELDKLIFNATAKILEYAASRK